MRLKYHKRYKGEYIYKNLINDCFIVYSTDDKIAKEAVKLFVQNDIDVNMPIFSYNNSECLVKNDIDVHEIISRSETQFGMRFFLELEKK